VFLQNDIPFFIDSPTNQQFPILTKEQVEALKKNVAFEIWEPLPDGRIVTRFATSWATPISHILQLEKLVNSVCSKL
jgi:threonine aldolase